MSMIQIGNDNFPILYRPFWCHPKVHNSKSGKRIPNGTGNQCAEQIPGSYKLVGKKWYELLLLEIIFIVHLARNCISCQEYDRKIMDK